DAVTLWDRLTIAPGVRLELISTGFEDELADPALERPGRRFSLALSPGVGAFVQTTPWLGVFGGVHRGFSPVAPGQPSTVDAEVATNYELGTRAVFKGLWAEAVGFFSDYDNMLGNCTFSAGCVDGDGSQQFNAGRVFTYGVETLARYRHRFDSGFGFEVGAQYTYTGSSFREAFTSGNPQLGEVERGDELPYVPKHIAGGSVGVGGRVWSVNVSPSYTSLMRDVAGQGTVPDGERIPGFFVLDVGAEVRVLQRFRIYTQVGNVTNNAYAASLRPFGLRPGAPLTFMVGVKASIFP
ncbi:MAG: TonB-dependent receptor, partial [Nannocystaceae bacterium]